jgi:aldehyde dehydrogenase (NAD+)
MDHPNISPSNMPDVDGLWSRLGLERSLSGVFADEWIAEPTGRTIPVHNPATGEVLAEVRTAGRQDYERVVETAQKAFLRWRTLPAPRRGEVIRELGNLLRSHKEDLGLLVTLEVGKIRSEGLGEVQEMIDMCDFATGLSRQLYGLTIASERPEHRLFEQWHPLGPVGVITAFNFPVAVWAWNAALSAVCGNATIWKPSPLAPLTAIAVQRLAQQAVAILEDPKLHSIFTLCVDAEREVGQWIAADDRIPLVSATGSCEMGRSVAQTVGARLGRTLLELGGNNAVIVSESADLDLALRACLFAAVGTAGQRCTTLRRLIVHESVHDSLLARLASAYQSIPVGLPWDPDVLMGPLIRPEAIQRMVEAMERIRAEGGEIITGGEAIARPGYYFQPTLVRAHPEMSLIAEETFGPLLYVLPYRSLEEAISLQNGVQQGLSSAIFTDRLREAETFLSATGSDCGIANVNIGTSGAEIGGAFGGEKETGGGREAGSDSWKAYMRRQTCTVHFGRQLPLAQGVQFELKRN